MKLTKSTLQLIGSCALATLFTGCASIMCGPKQAVSIDSRPAGAEVLVYDSRGEIIFQEPTPCVTHLARRDHDLLQPARYVVLIKKEGYVPVQFPLIGSVNRAYTANLLNAGIGYAIDPVTGAMWTLSPQGLDAKVISEEIGFFKDPGLLVSLKEEGTVPKDDKN